MAVEAQNCGLPRLRSLGTNRLTLAVVLLTAVGTALGQSGLPLQFKGICDGTQTDIRDRSAIQETPAIKCNSIVIAQINGHTVVSFSNADPQKPILMFSGDLLTLNTGQLSDPYIGPVSSALPIDQVLWDDGTPPISVEANAHGDKLAKRACYFHFLGQGWNQLSMVECDLAVEVPNDRPRRVTVTFRPERRFTVDGQQVTVEYGTRGANSFQAMFSGLHIDGTCGAGLYQTDGVLKHVQPGTSIARLFRAVCYKDAPVSQ